MLLSIGMEEVGMRPKKRLLRLSPFALAILGLSACGGDGGGGTTTPSTYTVTGTVPGTVIEAFCDDGQYFKTSSTNNGTDQHPFTLSLPNGVACQLVMTMNENDPANATITPIAYITPEGRAIALQGASASTVDLGYIPLPDATKGEAVLSDQDGNGVIDYYERLTREIEVTLEGAEVEVVLEANNTVKLEIDPDHDGIPNVYDHDDDNDGLKDWEDDDDDNDGIPDVSERDSDGDGVEDDKDHDDDNDGVPDNDDADYQQTNATISLTAAPITFTLPQNYTPDPTGARLLSAQCAQCHGTNGYSVSSFESLAGEADEVYEEIAEYHLKTNYDIMAAQAKIYTLDEAQKMQRFFLRMTQSYGTTEGYESDYGDDERYEYDD